jgi:hypothetical protein
MGPDRAHFFCMNITSAQLKYCLDKAAEITEQYVSMHIAHDDPRRSVDNLLHTCRVYLHKQIEVRKVDISPGVNNPWGAFEFDEVANKYIVAFAKNLPRDWERFILAKELFHVVMDQPEYHNMDLVAHIADMTFCFPSANSPKHEAVAIELLAEIATMEFLFPYRRRVEELKGPNKDNPLAIASKYDAPQVFCEAYMSTAFLDPMKPYFPD